MLRQAGKPRVNAEPPNRTRRVRRRLASGVPRSQIGHVATLEQVETAILRRMTPVQKLAGMHALWRQAWNLKAAGIHMQHPEWTSEAVSARVREILGSAGA